MSTLARSHRGSWVLVCLTVLATVGATARLQDAPVPMALQVSLFERIWTFDRSHEARLEDGLVIGVLYQSRVRSSALAKDAFVSAAASLLGPGVRIVEIDYRDPVALRSALTRERVDIVYVTPLRAVDIRDVAAVTRAARTLTCTGVAEYVSLGVSVGIELRDGRPEILVNRKASQQEGATFTSELLKLARLVEADP